MSKKQQKEKAHENHYQQEYEEEEGEYEEEEERGINLEDLELINNDKDWEPTEQQLEFYARKIGCDVDNDPDEFLEIALTYLKVAIPHNWQRAFDKKTGELFYINLETQEIDDITEIEEKAHAEYLKKKKQYIRALQQKTDKEKNKVKHQSPIKKGNDNECKENIAFDEDDDQEQDENNDDDDNEEEVNEGELHNSQSSQKKINIESLNLQDDDDQGRSDENIIIHAENSQSSSKYAEEKIGIIDDDDTDNNNNSDIIIDDIHTPTNNNKSKQPSNSANANNSKKNMKEYHDSKLKELNEYHNELESILLQSIEDYQAKSFEEYERKLISEKRKYKDDIESYYKEHLDNNENQLKELYQNEVNSYKHFIIKESNNSTQPSIDNHNDDDSSLQLQKNNLLRLIQSLKTTQTLKKQINQNDVLIKYTNEYNLNRERLIIQQEFLDKKHECIINQMEKDYELNFQREKTLIINTHNNPSTSLSKEITSFQLQTILSEYQKMLDELFILKSEEIKTEFEHSKYYELNDHTQATILEINSQIAVINQSTINLEKEYYDQLEALREAQRKMNHKRSDEIKEIIRNLPMMHDTMKMKIIRDFDKEVKDVIRLIQETIICKEGIDEIDYYEGKCEELIVSKGSDVSVAFQKSKAMYDLIEKEFKEKEVLIRYFIDVSKCLTSKLIENPMIDKDRSIVDNVIDDLLLMSKEKVSEYHLKGRSIKERKLFPFMDVYINEIMLMKSSLMRSSLYHERTNNINKSLQSFQNKEIFKQSQVFTANGSSNNFNSNQRLYESRSLQQDEEELQSTSYCNNNNNQLIPQSHLQSQSKPIELILSLPKYITTSLSNSNFNSYSKIIDFILQESSSLSQEQSLVKHQTDLNNQLTQINDNGDLLQLSNIFIEEKAKTIRVEQRYKSKSDLFSIIKTHISEVFGFIIANEGRCEIYNEKFQLLLKHIEDYEKYVKEHRKDVDEIMIGSVGRSRNILGSYNKNNIREIDSGAYNNFYAYHHGKSMDKSI